MANKRKDVIVVDFSKMEESEGGPRRFPEGDYKGKIIKAVRDVSSDKGSPCIKMTLKITEGKFKGKNVIERVWLSPKALPRLADMLEILGVKVKKTEIGIPVDQLVGKEIGFRLEDDEYEGTTRSKVAWDFMAPEDVGDEDDDDEEDWDEDDEDEDDEEEDDEDEEDEVDLSEMDRAELKAYIKENDLDVTVKKGMSEAKIRKAIEAAGSDDDELESLDLEEL